MTKEPKTVDMNEALDCLAVRSASLVPWGSEEKCYKNTVDIQGTLIRSLEDGEYL